MDLFQVCSVHIGQGLFMTQR